MKKKILGLMIVLVLSFSLCGCQEQEVEDKTSDKQSSMFVYVEKTSAWAVVYHKETKVMYVVSYNTYNYGTFTLLVDENGKPMTYEIERNLCQ